MTAIQKLCVSCNDDITASGVSVEFKCPNCGQPIVRCGKCRKLMIKWKCPSCGFEGP